MRRSRLRTALVLLALLAARTASADPPTNAAAARRDAPGARRQAAVARQEPRLEITFLGGRRAGGLLRVDTGDQIPLDVGDASAVAARIAWRLQPRLTLQAEYTRQTTDLLQRRPGEAPVPVAAVAIEYLQAGVRVRLSEGSPHAYLSATAGLMRLGSRDTGVADVFPSLSLGPGAILPLSSHVALTGDLRFFASLVGQDTEVPCQRPEAGCLRTGNDTVLLQLHALGGLTVRF